MTLLYNIFFIIFAVIYTPVLIVRGKWHKRLYTRWGKFDGATLTKLREGKNIWIHAVSVGEVNAVANLIGQLKEKYTDINIVCTTVTITGYTIAQKQLEGVYVHYAPFDLSWVVRRFIRAINPIVYIAAETEIWPNTYTQLHKAGVPIVIVNGRISDKAFDNYKMIRSITRKILGFVHCFCMQSEADKERIIALGASPDKVINVGNVKFDNGEDVAPLARAEIGYGINNQLLIAGSTHRGEEEMLVDAYIARRNKYPELRLIVVPRHVERADEICEMIKSKDLEPVKYSALNGQHLIDHHVLVVDQIGHLNQLYREATLVFVGKSLIDGGGQNIIEPARFGKPIIVGPYVQNFKFIVDTFLENNALIQVQNKEELINQMELLLNDANQLYQLGEAAKRVVDQNQGATDKTVKHLEGILS